MPGCCSPAVHKPGCGSRKAACRSTTQRQTPATGSCHPGSPVCAEVGESARKAAKLTSHGVGAPLHLASLQRPARRLAWHSAVRPEMQGSHTRQSVPKGGCLSRRRYARRSRCRRRAAHRRVLGLDVQTSAPTRHRPGANAASLRPRLKLAVLASHSSFAPHASGCVVQAEPVSAGFGKSTEKRHETCRKQNDDEAETIDGLHWGGRHTCHTIPPPCRSHHRPASVTAQAVLRNPRHLAESACSGSGVG